MFLTYLIILLSLITFEVLYIKIAIKCKITDNPNNRSSHSYSTVRGGGIVFIIAAWLYSIVFGFNYPYLLTGLTLLGVISFIDDIHSLSNGLRLIVQFISVVIAMYSVMGFTAANWYIYLLAIFIFMGILNAYNFMDGINGITAGYSLAILIPLLIMNSKINFIDYRFIIIILMSVVVFSIFNFRNNAICFAGDVGAIGIAFILSFLIFKLIIKSANPMYIIFLCVYGVDSALTIVHRIMLHEQLGKAHRKHLYQIMANELRINHLVVSSIYMSIQLIISLGFIYIGTNQLVFFISVISILIVTYIYLIRKYFYLHINSLNEKTR